MLSEIGSWRRHENSVASRLHEETDRGRVCGRIGGSRGWALGAFKHYTRLSRHYALGRFWLLNQTVRHTDIRREADVWNPQESSYITPANWNGVDPR